MRSRLRVLAAAVLVVTAAAAPAPAQVVQGSGTTSLVVSVVDPTDAALITAEVTITNAAGESRTQTVSPRGVAEFADLATGVYQVTAAAEAFRTMTLPVTVRQGRNQATVRLELATLEQTVIVEDKAAADQRDNGFTTTLTQEEIDALPDDPDEMAEELARMAGPGAQVFVDGFRGGRLPPKDQIQQIRFQTNSYAAEYHEAGMVRVEVITRPGMGGWRGTTNFGFRDESLNATNAFASEKGPEQMKRYMLSFSGPLAKNKTGVSISFDGNASYDSRTIVARSATGAVSDLAVSPTDAMNFRARVDHAFSPGSQVQAEYSRRANDRRNLGVGDFDLPERAYATDAATDTFRLRNTAVIGKKVFSELRVQFSTQTNQTTSVSSLPAIRVNDAFTSGGAGQAGERKAREFEVAQNFDFTIGRKHSMRAGVLVEAGWWDSTQRSNANGTYTFTSLDAYAAGLPATYSVRVGDPLVAYSQVKAGWYVQDDFRPRKTLQVSVGLRQELQTQVGGVGNLAPRAAFTWNATKKTTVRGGYGLFYDWYESNLHEQTVRVDGTHQIDVVVQNPGFPVAESSGTVLPPSIIRVASLDQPIVQQASIGVERPLTDWMDLRADYMWTRGSRTLRSVNVNAPVNGVRPDPAAGNITEIQSTGRRASDRLTVSINVRQPARRMFAMVMYQLGSQRNYADGATSLPADSTNPDADWGPSAQDVRHRLFFNVNTPIGRGVRVNLGVQGSSAVPYTMTTGRDDNGDTVFNDRPAGVRRNSERGAAQWSANLRVNRSFGLGGPRPGAGGMPMMPPPPGGAASNQRSPIGGVGQGASGALAQRGPGGGGGGGPQIMVMEASNARYRLDVFVNVQNLFNRVNYNAFVGNLLSPFYGTATSAGPARRVEVGVTLGF